MSWIILTKFLPSGGVRTLINTDSIQQVWEAKQTEVEFVSGRIIEVAEGIDLIKLKITKGVENDDGNG